MTNIFIDTNIVNLILDIDVENSNDFTYEEDRYYMKEILKVVAKDNRFRLYVNPTVKQEIDACPDSKRRDSLLNIFNDLNLTSFNLTILPFVLPATLISEEQAKMIDDLCRENTGLKKDKKIIADSAFCKEIDILLTADRKHLADKNLKIGSLKICTPKKLHEYLSNTFHE